MAEERQAAELKRFPAIMDRLDRVRSARGASANKSVREFANYPTLFPQDRRPDAGRRGATDRGDIMWGTDVTHIPSDTKTVYAFFMPAHCFSEWLGQGTFTRVPSFNTKELIRYTVLRYRGSLDIGVIAGLVLRHGSSTPRSGAILDKLHLYS